MRYVNTQRMLLVIFEQLPLKLRPIIQPKVLTKL